MTMKTLKELFEVYKPKSPDEQKFVDKHVTIKHQDRNGNGDDVFKGNTKYIKRKEERKGYDVGDDEKVYEEVEIEEAVEISHTRYLNNHGKKASGGHGSWMFTHKEYGDAKGSDTFTAPHGKFSDAKKHAAKWAKENGHSRVYVMENVEDLDEAGYGRKPTPYVNRFSPEGRAKTKAALDVAKAKIDQDKKAIAAKKIGEEVEDLEELSYNTLTNYRVKAKKAIRDSDTDDKTLDKRETGFDRAGKKQRDYIKKHGANLLNKEEVEDLDTIAEDRVIRSLVAYYEELGEEVLIDDVIAIAEEMIDELSKGTLGSYVKKASSQANKYMDKYTSMRNDKNKSDGEFSDDTPKMKDISRKGVNRLDGVYNANKKLANEDVESLNDGPHNNYGIKQRDAAYHQRMINHHNRLARMAKKRPYSLGSPDGSAEPSNPHHVFGHAANSAQAKIHRQFKKSAVKEEVEDLDESAKIADHLIKRYGNNVRKSHVRSAANDFGVGYTGLSHMVRKKLGVLRLEEEQIEQIDELSKDLLRKTGGRMLRKGLEGGSRADQHMKSANLASAKLYPDQYKKSPLKAKVNATNEEVEELDELRGATVKSYIKKAIADKDFHDKQYPVSVWDSETQKYKPRDQSNKKEVYHTREVNKRNAGLKRAYNKMAEEVEELDELSVKTLNSYRSKARRDIIDADDNDDTPMYNKRTKGWITASRQVQKKLTKEDVINLTLNKLMPATEDVEPLTPEEILISKLDGLSESHIHLLLSLFESLNEDNQTKMLSAINTKEGIDGLIDFAIENRGE